MAAAFSMYLDFFMKSYVPNCIKKDARALMYPVFGISRTPFIYWCLLQIGLRFFVAGICDFLLLAKMAEIPLFIGVSDVFNPKKSLRFFVAGILLFFCR